MPSPNKSEDRDKQPKPTEVELSMRQEQTAQAAASASFPEVSNEDSLLLYRKMIPPATPTVGRSVKFRDVFTLSGKVASNGTVVTVAGSATQTTLKSFTFFQNEWHIGMVVRLYAAGIYSNTDGTSTVALRVGLGLAPTTEISIATSVAAIVANVPWSLTWTGIVTSLGASGTIECQMQAKINNVNVDDANTAAFALNTTARNILALTADWDSADAGNSLSVRQFILEVL